MSKIKFILIIFLASCGQSEKVAPTDEAQFEVKKRENIVLEYVRQKGIDSRGRLNVYFFSDNTCMSCNRDKLRQSTALFESTKFPSVVIFDREKMLGETITNPHVTIISEKPEILSRKGLRFTDPCVFIFENDKFVRNFDLDMTFFENIDSMKTVNGL